MAGKTAKTISPAPKPVAEASKPKERVEVIRAHDMPEHVIVTTCTNCHVFGVGHPEKHMKTCDVCNHDSQIFVECLASIKCLTH